MKTNFSSARLEIVKDIESCDPRMQYLLCKWQGNDGCTARVLMINLSSQLVYLSKEKQSLWYWRGGIEEVYDIDCKCTERVKVSLGTISKTQGLQGTVSRGENVSLRVCKLVGKSVANSWLARVCQLCTHANSQRAYYVQTCCKSGGCQLGNGANLCKSVGKFENLQKFASRANPLKTLSLRFVCIQCKLLESV